MHRVRQQMKSAFVATAIAATTSGCAGRQPPRPAGPPGTPRVGWVIMSGDRDTPDHDFVCQSVQQSECVMSMSRADAQVFAHVYVYYHPAATETRYTGSVEIGFFEGAGGANTVHPALSVKPGGSPGNQSVVGIVRSQAGTYSLSIAVVATSAPRGASQDIRDEVRVTVR